jgi:hypothetical protein
VRRRIRVITVMKESAHAAPRCNADDGLDPSMNSSRGLAKCAISSDRKEVKRSAFWNAPRSTWPGPL